MDLYQLEAFVAVAQERSFSRAALRLHRTQSAVSQTIGKLEDTLGEKVFERSSRDGTLTAAGAVLLQYAEELLNLRERARDAISELRSLHEGKLTVAANEFTSLCLLPVLHVYHRLHPSIKIQVQRALAGDIARQVLTHQVEFGVLSFKPEDEQLSTTTIYRDELVFVVYPGHSLASVEKVSIHDLGAESFVAHNVTSPLRNKVIDAFKRTRTTLHMDVELPTLSSIKDFVRMGNGVALVPRMSVEGELQRGELVAITVNELRLERTLRLVTRKGATLSHAGAAFMNVCRSMAADPRNRALFEPEGENAAVARRKAGA
ncbi:MAG: LysR family transcriptional regulator [Acidobacteria bacterium]|nr:MAG: LysR family transcriptional regulator [Acidobacteriota bacterium]